MHIMNWSYQHLNVHCMVQVGSKVIYAIMNHDIALQFVIPSEQIVAFFFSKSRRLFSSVMAQDALSFNFTNSRGVTHVFTFAAHLTQECRRDRKTGPQQRPRVYELYHLWLCVASVMYKPLSAHSAVVKAFAPNSTFSNFPNRHAILRRGQEGMKWDRWEAVSGRVCKLRKVFGKNSAIWARQASDMGCTVVHCQIAWRPELNIFTSQPTCHQQNRPFFQDSETITVRWLFGLIVPCAFLVVLSECTRRMGHKHVQERSHKYSTQFAGILALWASGILIVRLLR